MLFVVESVTDVQSTPPSPASSPTPSSDDQPPVDARALLEQLESIYYPVSLDTLIPPPIRSHTVQHWYHARYSCSSSLEPRGAFAGVSRAILDARLGRVASGRHWGSKIHAPCLVTVEALDRFERRRGKVGESRVWCFESFGGAREIGGATTPAMAALARGRRIAGVSGGDQAMAFSTSAPFPSPSYDPTVCIMSCILAVIH